MKIIDGMMNPWAFLKKVQEIVEFYNRPFSMDILVNPIKDKYYESQDMMRVTVISDKWSQYESLRLFEGWEIDNEVRCYRHFDGEQYSKYPIVHFNGYDGLTLNDFITIFTKYNKGKLNFNEENATIKNLFKEILLRQKNDRL